MENMVKLVKCATLSEALERLGEIADKNEKKGRETVVFSDSKLTIEAEKAICDKVGGTFNAEVYTFAGFLGRFGKFADVLSGQQSVMVIRKIIDETLKTDKSKDEKELKLFEDLVGADAAESVYETISRLCSSGITPDALKVAVEKRGAGFKAEDDKDLLQKKLECVCVVFFKYEDYLAKFNKRDKPGRRKDLVDLLRYGRDQGGEGPVLRGKDTVFFGYQQFSATDVKIMEAAMDTAENVYGVLLSGEEKLYSNVACKAFEAAAKNAGMHCSVCKHGDSLDEEDDCRGPKDIKAEGDVSLRNNFRKIIFDPSKRRDGFRMPADGKVVMYEAQDEADEMEYIAAQIKKNICEGGMSYRDIAVTVPDLESARLNVDRIFSRYGIPYCIDAGRSLLSHPLYEFVRDFILCACYGAAPSYVDDIVASPYFPGDEDKKITFRNHMAKYGNYKGAVFHEADEVFLTAVLGPDALQGQKDDARKTANDVNEIRETLERALACFGGLENGEGIGKKAYSAVNSLFGPDGLNVYETNKRLCGRLEDDNREDEAQYFDRAPEAILSVMKEAAALDDGLDRRGYLKILESGIDAMKMPPVSVKLNAVFICDVSNTLLADKRVVFAAGMTEEVPAVLHDTRFISDEDIDKLATLLPGLGPKTEQDNLIARETAALNLCSFTDRLYLGYSVTVNGTGHRRSEALEYAFYAFYWNGDESPEKFEIRKLSEFENESAVYYCSELVPAVMWTMRNEGSRSGQTAGMCKTVKIGLQKKYGDKFDRYVKIETEGKEIGKWELKLKNAEWLYCSKGEHEEHLFGPTTLEEYFICPYKAFIEKGLKAGDNEGDDTQVLDIGNLYHKTFQKIVNEYEENAIKEISGQTKADCFINRAKEIACEVIDNGPLRVLSLTNKGKYDRGRLIEEVGNIAGDVFIQLDTSGFKADKVEDECRLQLCDKYYIKGIADRVDGADIESEHGEKIKMVRIIDYKSGSRKASCKDYYLGKNLQLELYLLAETEKMNADADKTSEEGVTARPSCAFYLRARGEYSADGNDVALSGFMDGTMDTDKALVEEVKVAGNTYYDGIMPKKEEECELTESFCDFLEYGRLVARDGAREMAAGNIMPSPGINSMGKDECDRCKFKGCCGFEVWTDGDARDPRTSEKVELIINAVRSSKVLGDAVEKKEAE